MNAQFDRLNEQRAEWRRLQPLKREDEERLWRKLKLDWNYHSNHLEGNTLTYGETELLLIHGQASGDHDLRNYVEMKAHDLAIAHLRRLVGEKRPLSETDIRDFNRILLKEPFRKKAITPDGQSTRIEILPGEYKKQPNNVRTASGEIFRFAEPDEVPPRMHELVETLRAGLDDEKMHPVELASRIHHDFVLIHPFGDGNGRVARLLVNYVLMRHGYLPLIVPTEQKDRYFAALRKADVGNLDALTEFLAACEESSMDRGIRAAKGESIEEPDDLRKEIELFKREQTERAKEVLPKSEQALRELYTHNLRPLISDFLEEMTCIDDLFTEVRIKFQNSYIQDDAVGALSQWPDNPDNLRSNGFQLNYELRGYKGKAGQPFNIACPIRVQFAEFHYIINMGNNRGANRLYGQPIPESERKSLAKEALSQIFAQIKKQTGAR